MGRRPRIGISACFFHADPERPIFKGKTLLYLEQSMPEYVMWGGAMPTLVPTPSASIAMPDIVEDFDGLLLHGGSDVCPRSYGEEPLRPEWEGDAIRDEYEIALFRECVVQGKPVFGICRGMQIINVAHGGTLYQDIDTQRDPSIVHRNWELYDQLAHRVSLKEGSKLRDLYGVAGGVVNSVHHQGIKDVGKDLVVEAESEEDGIVEAMRGSGPSASTYVFGVQWHPEFQPPGESAHLDPGVLMDDFLSAVRASMGT